MKQDMTPQEQAWQQAMKQHTFLPQEEHWQAMERLLDQQEKMGGIAPVETIPPPAPGMPAGWQSSIRSGLIIGLLLMAFYGYNPGNSPRINNVPVHKAGMHQRQLALQTIETESEKTIISRIPDHEPAQVTDISKSGLPRKHSGSKAIKPASTNLSSLSVAALADRDDIMAVQDALPTKDGIRYRMEVADIRTLAESEYTPGLMAFSRLIRPISKVPAPMIELAGVEQIQIPKRPTPFHYGLIVGMQSAIAEQFAFQSPLPHIGLFGQYRIKNNWYIQAELIAKWAQFNQIYASEEALDNLMADPGKSVSVTNSSGLGFVEMPVLVGYSKGRHSFQAGFKTALVYEIPASSENNQNGFPLIISIEGISAPPQKVDLGLTAGWSWMMSSRLALDLRTNYGLSNLIKQQPNLPRTFRNTDLMASVRWYW